MMPMFANLKLLLKLSIIRVENVFHGSKLVIPLLFVLLMTGSACGKTALQVLLSEA
jgi:hypothetical protein